MGPVESAGPSISCGLALNQMVNLMFDEWEMVSCSQSWRDLVESKF